MRKRNIISFRPLLFLAILVSTTVVLLFLQNISVTKSLLKLEFDSQLTEYSSTQLKQFDPHKNVLVFLHIQKTGGSDFDRAIVKHLLLFRNEENRNKKKFLHACEKSRLYEFENNQLTTKRSSKNPQKFKKYQCLRGNVASPFENWYFSRQTFGWVCGLHPDMTDLRKCVRGYYPNLKADEFFYFTILRHPFYRYISEWQHVSRGATWIRHSKNCLVESYERCFKGKSRWENVSLDEFMSCKSNLASNRQTRMLAQYDSQLGLCDIDKDSYERELLTRAKQTLSSMRFFSLNEYQHLSQLLFEKSFGDRVFKFESDLGQSNKSFAEAFIRQHNQTNAVVDKINELNRLDIELYAFAIKLFFERLKFYNIQY